MHFPFSRVHTNDADGRRLNGMVLHLLFVYTYTHIRSPFECACCERVSVSANASIAMRKHCHDGGNAHRWRRVSHKKCSKNKKITCKRREKECDGMCVATATTTKIKKKNRNYRECANLFVPDISHSVTLIWKNV